MPLYEYHCNACECDSEVLVKNFDEKPDCPQCGSKKLTKLLSVIGAPVIGEGHSASRPDGDTCGKPQCARGCMFGD
jgi:putative FmdB family regulatory protein